MDVGGERDGAGVGGERLSVGVGATERWMLAPDEENCPRIFPILQKLTSVFSIPVSERDCSSARVSGGATTSQVVVQKKSQ